MSPLSKANVRVPNFLYLRIGERKTFQQSEPDLPKARHFCFKADGFCGHDADNDAADQAGSCRCRNGGLVINDETKEVTVDGEPVKLTPIEYNILLLLVRNQGRVFSINQIYESIWEEEAIGADNTVAVHIRHIREKIEINPKEPRYLKVVWGVGYKIEKQP